MIIRKSLKYYQEKARIDKATNQRTAYKIQVYNNNKIDEFVKSYNSDNPTVKPSESMLWAELSVLNKPEVYRNYNRIINSKYTSNEAFEKMLVKNKANKELNRIVEAEVERIAKNLDYVEQVMQKYEVPMKMYNDYKAQQASKSLANRQKILNDVAVQANDLLVSEGINIPSNVFSYRNLDATAENLLRQSQMQAKHEEINAINDNYVNEGKDKIYKTKQWIWTGEGKTTRHGSNHLQIRQLNEPFIIVNDETLEIDELMYPSDPAGSPGNTFICYCDIEYLTEDEETWDILDSHIVNTPTMTDPALKSVTFGNASEILQAFKPEPKPELIDVNEMTYGNFSEMYKVQADAEGVTYNEATGKYSYKGLEAYKYQEKTNNLTFTPEMIEEHNAKINTEKLLNEIDADYEKAKAEFNAGKNDPVLETENQAFEPQGEIIDKTQLMDMGDGEYSVTSEIVEFNAVSGKYEYKGCPVEEYNPDYGIGTITEAEIYEHNKKLGVEVPEPSAIDTDKLNYSAFSDNYYVLEKYLTENPITGKYEVNGLEVKIENNEYGKYGVISQEAVDLHNKKFNVESNPKNKPHESLIPEPEIIDKSMLETGEYGSEDKYFVDGSSIKYNSATGKYEYKGLEVEVDDPDVGTFITEAQINEHNIKLQSLEDMAGTPAITEYIEIDDMNVFESNEKGTYVIDTEEFDNFKYNSETGKYEVNGLELETYDPVSKYGTVSEADLFEHNLENPKSAGEAIPTLLNNKYINRANSIKTLKIGDDIYMEDTNTGKRYVYDKKAEYERKQDQEQYKVQFTTNETNSMEHWGKYGHQYVNGLLYRQRRVKNGILQQDYSYFSKYMDKLVPKYDKIQELSRDYNNGKISEGDYMSSRKKLIDECGEIIDNVEDPNFESLCDLTRIKNAMWEIAYMDIAVEKSPPLLQDTFLVRFGHINPEWLKVGKTIKFDGFGSTTYESNSASYFESKMADNPNRWAILIMAEEGTNGSRLNSRQFDAYATEREWMLARNQEAEIVEFHENERVILIKVK